MELLLRKSGSFSRGRLRKCRTEEGPCETGNLHGRIAAREVRVFTRLIRGRARPVRILPAGESVKPEKKNGARSTRNKGKNTSKEEKNKKKHGIWHPKIGCVSNSFQRISQPLMPNSGGCDFLSSPFLPKIAVPLPKIALCHRRNQR